jgi:GT2 family glycosyltransferase/ubiquinone/menaquinone biosynthesis C-methylase UbiE
MIAEPRPLFSIIVPTRNRPDGLRRLLDSIGATTMHPGSLEVILVIDADDTKTIGFVHEGVSLKRVVVQPGLNMGALNMAGYEVATGDYLMLLNDDVIVRTRGWDEKILAAFKTFADGIVLVHVNDKIFEDKLCTFPFLSRKYCDMAAGICPRDYIRYRIDDHIYNVFNLLAVLGKIRILYLPDVVFEHTNYVLTSGGGVEYQPDENIHETDSKRFHDLLQERKRLALRLIEHIEGEVAREKKRIWENMLGPIADSVALRRPEYIRVWSEGRPLSSDNRRVAIGVVSANLQSEHARTCIDLIKKFTKNFDLMILDNNRKSDFNHPHEMNKLLSMCDTDYLVLMDDDVFVEPGWLDGMLRCMAPAVGVVTPLHKDRTGNLSYAGVVMRPDNSGHHTHSFAIPDGPGRIQTLCSAIMLIDMCKCGKIRFDESYSKYFLDIDYGLQIWSKGYEVVCSPFTLVTHIGGGTLQQGSALSNDLFEMQRQHFVREWVDTGRYRQLEQGIWSKVPEIQNILNVAPQVDSLLAQQSEDREQFRARALALFKSIREYPALVQWSSQRIWDALRHNPPQVDDPESGHLAFLLGCTPHAVLFEKGCNGLNIFLYNTEYFAVPEAEGRFDYERIRKGSYSQIYRAEDLNALKTRIHARISDVPPSSGRTGTGRGELLFEGWRILRNERLRLGSWKSALRSVGKPWVKDRIISTFGIRAFFRLKDIYWQVKTEKHKRQAWLPAAWLGTKLSLQVGCRFFLAKFGPSRTGIKNLVPATSESTRSLAPGANPERWLDASPVTLVESDYRGYSVYRFEYKYFATVDCSGAFNYEEFKQGKYKSCLIGHSLNEVHAAVDEILCSRGTNSRPHNLVFACLPPPQLQPLLERTYPLQSISLLVQKSHAKDWAGYKTISIEQGTVAAWARAQDSNGADPLTQPLLTEDFDCVIIPWSFPETWADNSLERAAAKIAKCVEVIDFSGTRRVYRGENLHRLVYNKAYLASMFQSLPSPHGLNILEAGCSDGLVCDILALAGAKKVVGIDVMKSVGCGFSHDHVQYEVMDVSRMTFPDRMFDIVYSIATFEHLASPYQALLEMLRVTKVGGYGYIQAGPLYHSPFGHHMFEYFRDYPWIHLRKSKDEIVLYAKERGIDKFIERDLSMKCEQYIEGMLNVDHVNGLLLQEYRLKEFRERDDIEILKFNISYEGGELLTPEISAEIPGLNIERLVEHGFEIAFRRTL